MTFMGDWFWASVKPRHLAFEKGKLLQSWYMLYRKSLWELREKHGCIPAGTLSGNPKIIKKKKLWYNPSIVWKLLQPAFTVNIVSGSDNILLLVPTDSLCIISGHQPHYCFWTVYFLLPDTVACDLFTFSL